MSRPLLAAATVGIATAVSLAVVVALVGTVRSSDVAGVGNGSDPDGAPPTQQPMGGAATADAADDAPGTGLETPGTWEPWARNGDGQPVRWDPCTPIGWVLEADGAPDDAREVVSQAVARVEAASGLRFRFLGTTAEVPSTGRTLVVDDGADGLAWAPVLVSWSAPSETDLPMTDATRGVAVPVAVATDGGARVFVTGQLALNSDMTGRLLDGFEDRHASWGATVLHELMHLVGLAHVDDPAELMFPAPGFGPVTLGDGDRAGLTALGEGGCVTVPAARDLDVTYAEVS